MSKPLPIRDFVPNLREAWREWKEDPDVVTGLDMVKISFWYCYFYLKGRILGHYDELDD